MQETTTLLYVLYSPGQDRVYQVVPCYIQISHTAQHYWVYKDQKVKKADKENTKKPSGLLLIVTNTVSTVNKNVIYFHMIF